MAALCSFFVFLSPWPLQGHKQRKQPLIFESGTEAGCDLFVFASVSISFWLCECSVSFRNRGCLCSLCNSLVIDLFWLPALNPTEHVQCRTSCPMTLMVAHWPRLSLCLTQSSQPLGGSRHSALSTWQREFSPAVCSAILSTKTKSRGAAMPEASVHWPFCSP